MYELLHRFVDETTSRFSESLASGQFAFRELNHFQLLLGDGGGGYFQDPDIVDKIAALAEEMLPFKLRWAVAENEWDEACSEILIR